MTPSDVTKLFSVMTIVGQVFVMGLMVASLKKGWLEKWLGKLTQAHFLVATYAISLIATLGSLYYSEIAGYDPCKLCWYQRILMYPQVILYFVALLMRDMKIRIYGVVLSVLGGLLALYHYLLQVGILKTTSCSTVGFSISCSERFSTTFGYITIPMMSLTAFGMILALWWVEKKLFDK